MSTVDKNVLTRMTGRKPNKLVQLVQDLDDVNAKHQKPANYLYHVTTKLDGVYALFVWIAGGWATFSRTGEQMKSCGHIERHLEELKIPKTVVVVGEVLLLNPAPEGSPEESFEDLSYATVQETSGAFRRHQRDEALRLVVHDFLSDQGFEMGATASVFANRIARALRCGVPMTRDKNALVRIPEYTCVTLELARLIAEQVIDDGGEGVIVRDLEATWEAGKRDHRIMRIKEKITKDLRVVGVKEGVGKMAGMAGTLTCKWHDTTIEVAGGDFLERKAWFMDPSLIVGQIVEVEAMKVTPKGVLREPRFKGIRFDKTEADA
jgi:ATP-dependent DNA ligase